MITARASLYAIFASLVLLGAASCDSQTTPEGAAPSHLGYKINCRKFDLSYLLNSDFAFLTNSLRGMAYISKVNKQMMPPKPNGYERINDALHKRLNWSNS